MNLTYCTKGDRPKCIHNLWRKCLECESCRLVIGRHPQEDGIPHTSDVIYLLYCPNVEMRHKIIGKDTWHSKPRARIDLVQTGLNLGDIDIQTLSWQEYAPPLEPYERTEIAEIPRDLWQYLR